MNRWLQEGKDVNAMLPYFMRYMGHTDVKNTLYHSHLVPDIYGRILDRPGHYSLYSICSFLNVFPFIYCANLLTDK